MVIKTFEYDFSVSKLSTPDFPKKEFCFTAICDNEYSLVSKTTDVPDNVSVRDDGWRMFRIEGTLDFSLIGILSKIASLLAENGISIFAISTYNTDYVLVKNEKYLLAKDVLKSNGYTVI